MNLFSAWLKENKALLKKILNFSHKRNITLYLVGGILRDILLDRKKDNPDIDFCLEKNAISFARNLSRELRCGFVVLDRINGCARLVKKIKGATFTLDFTDFRGKTLNDDLFHRDFTINSMAVALASIFSQKEFDEILIDPYAARKDFKSKIIRLLNRQGFDEDPLRILRAFSLASIFGFQIERKTLQLVKLKRRKLSKVSYERIRDEFFKILATKRAYEAIVRLDKYKIIDLAIPEIIKMRTLKQGPYHHLEVWTHSLETFRHLELLLDDFSKNTALKEYLDEEVSFGRRRYELIKFAALLHDIGKPKTLRIEKGKVKFHGHERVGAFMIEEIGTRFKLSNDEIRRLKQIVFAHLRPGYLADTAVLTRRAKFRFFRDSNAEAVSVLLISLADQRATCGRLATQESRRRHERLVRRLIKEYFEEQKEEIKKRLINGNDLIKHFSLEPSPLIGKVLKELEESQAVGRVKTKEEALAIAAKIIKSSR